MFGGSKLPRLAAMCLLAASVAAAQSPDTQEPTPPAPQQSTPQPSSDPSQPNSSTSPSWHSPSKYNPMKLIKRNGKSANDQLAANEELEQRLTTQLQAHGVLEKDASLQDKCSTFKSLQTCVAVFRASSSLKVEFLCLKWDVTGVKPTNVSDACAGPSDRKAMSFHDAISLLKPSTDAKQEADKALKSAFDDIKDASS
jgi:hypothetical protein